MSNVEFVGTYFNTDSANGNIKDSMVSPRLCEDLIRLINELPAGARVGIECGREMINNTLDDSLDYFDPSIKKINRNIFFGEVIRECNENELEIVYLLDDALYERGKEISKVSNLEKEKIKEPVYGFKVQAENNYRYFKHIGLPDDIFKNIHKNNLALAILSRGTLDHFIEQRPKLKDYSDIDLSGIFTEKVDTNKETRLVKLDLNNNSRGVTNDSEYSRVKVLSAYLVTSG